MSQLISAFKRGIEHNYLIIKYEEEDISDYQIKMLSCNKINGVLPLQVKSSNGQYDFQYEISSLMPLSTIFEHRQLEYENLIKIITGLIGALKGVHEYLIDENCIVLEPEYIYVDVETFELHLLVYPYYDKELQSSIVDLAEFILDKVNHQNNDAVMIAYSFFKEVRNDNFTISNLEKLLNNYGYKNTGNSVDAGNLGNAGNSLVEYRDAADKMDFGSRNIKSLKVNERAEEGRMIIDQADCNLWEDGYEQDYEDTKEAKDREKKTLFSGLFGKGKNKKAEKSLKEKLEKDTGNKNYNSNRNINKNTLENDSGKDFENDDDIDMYSRKEPEQETFGKTVLLSPDDKYNGYDLADCHTLKYKIGMREQVKKLEELPLTIGKVADCVDLVVKDSSISRMHATIYEENGKLFIRDCGSTNGTFVNEVMICDDDRMPLEEGDEIRLGKVVFYYD